MPKLKSRMTVFLTTLDCLKLLILMILAVLGVSRAGAQTVLPLSSVEAWNWPLPPERFARLSQIERMDLTRAEALLKGGNYAAAAIEFEKFAVQYPQSELGDHYLLMRAYSLHQARSRHTAIDVYTQLIDWHAFSIDAAAPAMWLMGNAHLQNGDIEPGIAVLSELADHPRYSRHPIADIAMNQVADHYAGIEDDRAAERYWRRVLDLQAGTAGRSPAAALEARTRLADHYVRTRRYDALESALIRGNPDPGHGRAIARLVNDRALRQVAALDARAGAAFLAWFKGRRALFTSERDLDDFLERMLRFAVALKDRGTFNALRSDFEETDRLGVYLNEALGFFGALQDDRAIAGALRDALAHADGLSGGAFENALAWIVRRMVSSGVAERIDGKDWERLRQIALRGDEQRSPTERERLYRIVLARMAPGLADAGALALWDTLMARALVNYRECNFDERNNGIAGLIDIAGSAQQHERALDLTAAMDNRPLAVWKIVHVYQRQRNWQAAAAACEDLEKMDDTSLALQALRTRAELYKDRLARYEEAIQLYNQINEPPRTVWEIVDCYVRWQRPADAYRTLTELENFFEREAPQAAWRKALIWEQFKDQPRMVAAARAVLRRYPEHSVSSQAHQLLNRYGVGLVGGGLMDADD